MASKLVIDRQKKAEAVVAVGETQADMVGEALAAQLQPHLRAGETMPDCALLMRLMGRSLQASRAALVAADATHEAELADDAPARQERDRRSQALFARLVELREVLQGLFGAGVTRTLMPSLTPSDPVVLSRFAGEVMAALATTELPPSRIAGATMDIATTRAELQALRDALEAQLATVAQEVREAQATLAAKRRALATYDEIFAGVSTAITGLLQLAGEHELASQVKPSRRRAARPAAVPGGVPAGDGEPDAGDAGGTPADEPPAPAA